MLRWKFVKFLMSILNRQVNSSSNFASFFIVMTHNLSVNFKHIHFLLWIKGSYQSPNFETFKCHIPNQKSVFLEILYHSSVSWKITALYFFRSNVIYFAQMESIKGEIFRILSAQVKIHRILVIFEQQIRFSWNFASLFSVMRHNTSILF